MADEPNVKPGWQTTEFWLALAGQVLAVLVLLGLVSASDAKTLGDEVGKIIGAVAVIAVSGWVVVSYIRGRVLLKGVQQTEEPPANGGTPPVLPLVLLALILWPSQGMAAEKPHVVKATYPCLCGPSCDCGPVCDCDRSRQPQKKAGFIGLGVGWGGCCRPSPQPQQPVAPYQSDPVQTELMRQILQGQQQIQQQQMRLEALVLQRLPIEGQPRQVLPIEGKPKQDLPPEGKPKQDLPPEGRPRQDLPPEGKPRQELPVDPMPKVLPDQQPPTGYQRYAIWRPSPRGR